MRAYRGDLNDVAAWCNRLGVEAAVHELQERHLFAYLVDQVRRGRSAATIRRRMAALTGERRAHVEVDGAGRSPVDRRRLLETERLIAAGVATRTAALVVSDDPIFRAGVRSVLADHGILCWADRVSELDPATIGVWDVVLAKVASRDRLDPYAPIRTLRALGDRLATVPVVAVAHPGLHPVVRLRLAEAGVRYLVPDSWLADHLDSLAERIRDADIPIRYHLETPLAMRQSLGLSLAGDLQPLLDAALALPPAVWLSGAALDRLPLSRADVRRIRTLALEVAGIPAPDFARYASSMRTAPSTPEWVTVRSVVRAALGIEEPS